MWNVFFTLSLCGVIISAATKGNSFWFIFFNVAMYICVAGVVLTHEKQKEKIENLEKRLKERVGAE